MFILIRSVVKTAKTPSAEVLGPTVLL